MYVKPLKISSPQLEVLELEGSIKYEQTYKNLIQNFRDEILLANSSEFHPLVVD